MHFGYQVRLPGLRCRMIIIYLAILVAGAVFFFLTRNYQKEKLCEYEKKEHPLKKLYPMSAYAYHTFLKKVLRGREQKNQNACRMLEPRVEQSYENYMLKKISTILLMAYGMIFIATCAELSHLQTEKEQRQGNVLLSESEKDGQVILKFQVEKEGGWKEEQIEFSLNQAQEEQEKTQEEMEQEEIEKKEYKEAYEYIDSVIMSRNEDTSHILTNLFFPATIPGTNLKILWTTSPNGFLDETGKIISQEFDETKEISVIGSIYQEDQLIGEYKSNFTLITEERYRYEEWRSHLQEEIQKKCNQEEDALILPKEYEGKQIQWGKREESSSGKIAVVGLILAIIIFWCMDEELQTKVKKRKKQMMVDYPDILNKLTLLIGAGMTISGAWNRVVEDYMHNQKLQDKKKTSEFRYAYEEMVITNQELKLGASEIRAIEEFGKRSEMIAYMKFSSLLIQNAKKGTEGLTTVLELMAAEAFENRKQRAKQLGEEAGTKLLMPMMLMLVLVMVIIMVPAFWSMNI